MLKALGGFASTGGGGGVGAVTYKGTWDAATNTPTLASGTGTQGDYYVVNVPGSTNLDGITDWAVGDWAIFNGTVWEKVDNTDAVSSVNGQVGTVVLNAANVGAIPDTTVLIGGVGITVTGNLDQGSTVSVDLDDTLVVAGSYGNASAIPVLTIDQQGRITDANVAIVTASVPDPLNLNDLIVSNATVTNTFSSTASSFSAGNVSLTGSSVNVTAVQGANVTVTSNLYANLASSSTAAMPDPSLPLNPEGYINVVINGTTKKIPYYGV